MPADFFNPESVQLPQRFQAAGSEGTVPMSRSNRAGARMGLELPARECGRQKRVLRAQPAPLPLRRGVTTLGRN